MLSIHAKRTVVVGVRMTVVEKEAIIARASRKGKSVSDWLRSMAMHYITTEASGQASKGPADIPVKPPVKYLGSASGEAGA